MKITLSFVCFSLLLIGCQSEQYLNTRPFTISYDDAWGTTYKVLSRRYYIIKASKEDGTMETEWDNEMSVHYMDSYRYKVHIKVEEYERKKHKNRKKNPEEMFEEEYQEEIPELPEPGEEQKEKETQYVVRVNVESQQNRNMDEPSNPKAGVWIPVGRNSGEETLLVSFLNARLSLKENTFEKEELKTQQEFERYDTGELP